MDKGFITTLGPLGMTLLLLLIICFIFLFCGNPNCLSNQITKHKFQNLIFYICLDVLQFCLNSLLIFAFAIKFTGIIGPIIINCFVFANTPASAQSCSQEEQPCQLQKWQPAFGDYPQTKLSRTKGIFWDLLFRQKLLK